MTGLKNLSLGSRIYRLSGTVILIYLLVIGFLFLQFRTSQYQARQQELKNLVESGWHILQFHARQAADGILSTEEAKRRALQIIRNQRFENGNYFWISDLKPRMVMHPINPEIEGRDLLDQGPSSNSSFLGDLAELVSRSGAGFIEHRWPRPGEAEPVAKITYAKGFSTWGWMIGSGVYVDDIDEYLLRLLFGAGVVLTLVTAGALLLATWVAHSISTPMGRAVAMIEALEQGDLDHRLHLDQQDEIGRLARAMDGFADNLQHEILSAFDHLARGDFSFNARGLIREPLAQTNTRLNALVAKLDETVATAVEERAKTESLIAAMGDGVAIYDLESRFIFQNPAHIGLTGYHVGEPCSHAYDQGEHACSECAVARSLADGKINTMERHITAGGRDVYLDITASPLLNAAGEVISVIEIVRDVSSRKETETALIESEARYSNLFRNNHTVMLVIDPATDNIVDANPSAVVFYGYDPAQLIGMKFSEINTLNAKKVFRETEAADNGNRHDFHFRHLLASGEMRDVEVHSGPIQVQGKELIYSIVNDITERKRAETQIEYLAFHDSLTGLANRALFEDRLILTLTRALRNRELGALFFLDLDRFKVINDSLGHYAGDQLLIEVGNRLKALVRNTDTVSRSGGDEFMLLFPESGGPDNAAHLATKILSALAEPFMLEGREICISASIGISLYPGDGADLVTLLRNADTAMYLAKQKGRNNFQFFTPELTLVAQERLLLENELRQALAEDELQLQYQPQFNAATGKIVGVEALARWFHPSRGWISPAQFIPIAEESGLIEQLGTWVLRTACAQNKHWQALGYEPIKMAVNVSGRQFEQSTFIDMVDRVLAETGIDPRWLELEVTENILMTNVEETIQVLVDLKSRHISLAIDDFGTGYSSLGYLRQFPIDRLKIDQSFVADITTDLDDAAIASAIISLARTLNLEVIAEGVETAEQALFLREHQCDTMQGYYFGRPSPPEKLASLFEDGSTELHGGYEPC